jgi:hypothetical protein
MMDSIICETRPKNRPNGQLARRGRTQFAILAATAAERDIGPGKVLIG